MNALLRPTNVARDEFPGRQLPEPSVAPQLLWPSIRYRQQVENSDVSYFPHMGYILGRYKASNNDTVLKLVAFAEAVMKAEKHILILDPHFDKIGANMLGPALEFSQVGKVRLLTRRGAVTQTEREELRRELTQYCNLNRVDTSRVNVRWSATLDNSSIPFLHDRFAIVDESLWHFGSTVGGGHPGLTAVSGPWSATRTRAEEFFEECWGICNA